MLSRDNAALVSVVLEGCGAHMMYTPEERDSIAAFSSLFSIALPPGVTPWVAIVSSISASVVSSYLCPKEAAFVITTLLDPAGPTGITLVDDFGAGVKL